MRIEMIALREAADMLERRIEVANRSSSPGLSRGPMNTSPSKEVRVPGWPGQPPGHDGEANKGAAA
jgi:hypothetical protein